jgi:hypothetical protein
MFCSLTEGASGAQAIFDWAAQYAQQRFKTAGALIMVGGWVGGGLIEWSLALLYQEKRGARSVLHDHLWALMLCVFCACAYPFLARSSVSQTLASRR